MSATYELRPIDAKAEARDGSHDVNPSVDEFLKRLGDFPFKPGPPIDARPAADLPFDPTIPFDPPNHDPALRTIVNNGSPDNRIDIVVLGDGYTNGEIDTTYTDQAHSLIDHLFFSGGDLTQPFGRYASFFNFHLIDVVSPQSGIDQPDDGVMVATALDASYDAAHFLTIDVDKANAVVESVLDGTGITADIKLVTLNSSIDGGVTIEDFAIYNGGAWDGLDTAAHEMGHSFAHLGDAYYGGATPYTGAEPNAPNLTTDPAAAKWSHWLGYEQPGIGTIGAYEGGGGFASGIFRPSQTSKMNSDVYSNPFDAVSREAFILEFYEHVDPIDDYAYKEHSGPLVHVERLWIDTIDDEIIETEWYVDGRRIDAVNDETSVTLHQLGIGLVGTYTVDVLAFDPTDWVRLADRSSLQETVTWQLDLDGFPPPDFDFGPNPDPGPTIKTDDSPPKFDDAKLGVGPTKPGPLHDVGHDIVNDQEPVPEKTHDFSHDIVNDQKPAPEKTHDFSHDIVNDQKPALATTHNLDLSGLGAITEVARLVQAMAAFDTDSAGASSKLPDDKPTQFVSALFGPGA